ncbi:beta-N-acetylhexosaminidase [Nordella sp. HKS 07]|uniref:beta-N-acetylhexosaminidase n=1 Tax=Nordella sp. HKS 07 TaxID=2712222 RepID=UPI0013E1BD41|nr:beta-N-acetylhexosaminidase [Nordella sp. HKS 07]QIG50654.1 beta-N-acetylhexosaminidase [Nordella sp. HKS 07]
MAPDAKSLFRLDTQWTAATASERAVYALILTNLSSAPVKDFLLCFSGPARIDPAAEIENGRLHVRLSNHTELSPPDGFVLEPGASWRVVARGVSYPLCHWSDGATTAYLAFADLTTLSVRAMPTRSTSDNAPLRNNVEAYPVPETVPAPVSIIPWPEHVAVSERRAVPKGLALKGNSTQANGAIAAFGDLVRHLFPAEALLRPPEEGGYTVDLKHAEGLGPEAYSLRFLPVGATLRASTQSGFLYGLVTLGQVLRGARQYPETFLFPGVGQISDRPAYGWRGTHLDVARQFYAADEVRQFLRILAWNKLNRFHWHLTDDEAWRIESSAYPELNSIGAWRGHGLPIPPLFGSSPEPSGGYYSKDVIRGMVTFAADLGIDIVPEIDVPGHCFAAQQSLPWLHDPHETGEYFSIQGYPNNCINPAGEETYRFMETVLDELIELFPSRTIHVGADEVPADAWSRSPQAKAKLAELQGSGRAELQAHFLRRVQAHLTARGRITGAWEEAAHGGGIDKANCYLNGWHSVEINAKLAEEGYDIVVCPAQVYYLDMAHSAEWAEPGASWAGWSSLEKTYAFDPAAGWSDAQKRHLLGVQTCIWSEPMTDRRVFNRLVFPRISAMAETGWTKSEAKSWPRFRALAGLMPALYPR